MKRIKLPILSLAFLLCATMIFGQTGQTPANCNGAAVEISDVEVPGNTPEGIGDSTQAVIAYSAWVVSLVSRKVKCKQENNCTTYQNCKKKLAGIGANGTFPTPTQSAGEWEFPDQGTTSVFIKCKCVTGKITVFEVLEFGDYTILDPLAGEGNEEESVKRNLIQHDLINVYPNPTKDQINIDFENTGMEGEVTIYVHNSIGQQIRKADFDAGNAILRTIDTSYYKSGIYFLTVSNKDGIIKRAKFVIED